MTSIDFVKNKLNELINLFPTIKCTYEFDSFDNTHIVEVLPSDFYKQSHLFYKKSAEIDFEFIDKFPYEGLYFIDSNDLMPIKNKMYEVVGRDYNLSSIYSFASPQTICIPTIGNISAFSNDLDNLTHDYLKDAIKINSLCTKDKDVHFSKLGFSQDFIIENSNTGNIEQSYAMVV